MDATIRDKFGRAVAVLAAAGERIRDIEKRAGEALHEKGDEAGYRLLMREKCDVLMGLPEAGEAVLAGASGGVVDELRDELKSYASRAGRAVSVGSVFYMSALLYPDDYKDGEPNDLEQDVARFSEFL